MPVAEVNLPGGQRIVAAAKGKFHRARVEAVVLHPANDGLNEILQRGREAARGELVLVAGAKQSFAKFVGDLPGDSPDPRARLLRREVAPALAFLLQLLMKLRENLVLETALLARVGFEELPFLRPQAEVNEKFERAGGELFQRADRGVQRRAVKLFCQRGRKRIPRRVGRQRAQLFPDRREGRQRSERRPTPH